MDLFQMLNQPYSKQTTVDVVREIISNNAKLIELIDLFNHSNERIGNYSSWIISYIGEENPELLKKHLPLIIRKLESKENSQAMLRNIFRTLQFVEIPEKQEGFVVTKGFEFLNNNNSSIAVKVFSMTVIFNLSKKYTEIQNELKLSLENQLGNASAGFKSRATKILKNIK